MGKSTINGQFSIAMLNYQRVGRRVVVHEPLHTHVSNLTGWFGVMGYCSIQHSQVCLYTKILDISKRTQL